jgi:hypothetical protein
MGSAGAALPSGDADVPLEAGGLAVDGDDTPLPAARAAQPTASAATMASAHGAARRMPMIMIERRRTAVPERPRHRDCDRTVR